jgi:hypothetical protein
MDLTGWRQRETTEPMSPGFVLGIIHLLGSADPVLDHLIRPLQERRRDGEAEGLRET